MVAFQLLALNELSASINIVYECAYEHNASSYGAHVLLRFHLTSC